MERTGWYIYDNEFNSYRKISATPDEAVRITVQLYKPAEERIFTVPGDKKLCSPLLDDRV